MIISAGMVDWPCGPSSRLSADDDDVAFEGEYSSILRSGSTSPAMDMVWIESWSLNETPDLLLLPVGLTTETLMSPLFLM